MTKSINRQQSEVLLNKMSANPDIAKGFVKAKGKKEIVETFWKSLQKELNSAGPPVESVFEWKKVWMDQKRYVRKKAASNKQHQRGTGGGPNRQWKLSPSEDAIFQLINMEEAVGGVVSETSFGLPASAKRNLGSEKENEEPYEEPLEYLIEEVIEECSEVPIRTSEQPTSSQSKIKSKLTTSEVVVKELEVQQKLCDTVCEAVALLKTHQKEVQYCAKKIYRSIGEIKEIEKNKLEEMKRHNKLMEDLRKVEIESKIEKNKKLIEIAEMKLQIQQNNNSIHSDSD